jgi:hypothetical protein
LPQSLEKGEEESQRFLPDLLKDASKLCRVDPSEAAVTINLATNVRILEGASQQLAWLFEFGFAPRREEALEEKTKDWINNQFSGARSQFSLTTARLVEQSGFPEEQRYKLFAVSSAIATSLKQLRSRTESIVGTCVSARDRYKKILEILDPTK